MSLDYDVLAESYDELYSGEQEAKYRLVLRLVSPEEPVLDAGCGTGLLMRHVPCYSVGLDASAGMLRVAKRRSLRGDLVRGDARMMPFRSRCFPVVYSVTVVHEAPSMIGELIRVLKPGGRAAITLLKKRLELLPLILSELEGAEVHDSEELKDVIIVFRKPSSSENGKDQSARRLSWR